MIGLSITVDVLAYIYLYVILKRLRVASVIMVGVGLDIQRTSHFTLWTSLCLRQKTQTEA